MPFNRDQRYREGKHSTSKYWQNFKASLPSFTPFQISAVIGIVMGDSGLSNTTGEARIKVEQGYKQKAFVDHLFELLGSHCFIVAPGLRVYPNTAVVKSWWFKTWALPQLTLLWELLYTNGLKTVPIGFIINHVDVVALSYWFICDGSRTKNIMVLHTQNYDFITNQLISKELNDKFGLNSQVKVHKSIYYCIHFNTEDSRKISSMIRPYVIESLAYKLV